MNLEKNQIMTTLQKFISNTMIESAFDQLINFHDYQRRKIRIQCLNRSFIIKLILYLIIREGNNLTQITNIQFEIKKIFAQLPGVPKDSLNPKRIQRSFLFEILLVSQITHQIAKQLKYNSLTLCDPETIFIILVFLSTDKLVSPKCFAIIHRQLQLSRLPFEVQYKKQPVESLSSSKVMPDETEFECFKEQVRSIIHPRSQEKQRLKNSHSVGLMLTNFKNKENMNHYRFNKAIRETSHPHQLNDYRIRKCFSQNGNRLLKENQNFGELVGKRKFNWSKCELIKNNYVPFSTIPAPVDQKHKSISSSYLKFKKIREKTVHFQEKRYQLILKT